MPHDTTIAPAFVIRAEELPALNYLPTDHPRPRAVEWINRGTDQILKRSSVEMLLRTLSQDMLSPSAVRLHRHAGLRIIFRSERERASFARAFDAARAHESVETPHLVTAIFDSRERAERAVSELRDAGIPDTAISLLWRASQFMDMDSNWIDGHGKLSIASAAAGSGIAGAMLGVALLTIPGVGPVAAAGTIAASAFSSVAAVSGVIGATGGVIARMLTDHDVDSVTATYFEQQIRQGKIFVSVDTRIAEGQRDAIRQALAKSGGRSFSRA